MKIQMLQRLFCITLFMQFCPSIFSASAPNAPIEETSQALQDRDIFESLMTVSREHTQNIGFCIQQILQTVDAGKIKLDNATKIHVVSELMQLQGFIKVMMEELYVQNTKAALFEVVLLNNTVIHFMMNVLQQGLPSIQLTQLMTQLQKKSQKNLPDELILNMAQGNAENIEKLIYASVHIGLTWYNSVYRNLKKYNAYSVVKVCGVGIVAAVVAGYVMCGQEWTTGIKSIDKHIGSTPSFISSTTTFGLPTKPDGFEEYNNGPIKQIIATANGKQLTELHGTYYLPLKNANPTICQSIYASLKKANNDGLIAMGALISFSLQDVIKGLFRDYWAEAQEYGNKKYRQLDKKLSGTEKPNAQEEGYEKVYFKDMVGSQELEHLAKKIANFMKYPERYERAQIEEHRGILLHGPPQTGKTAFAKALRTLIDDEIGQKIPFINAKDYIDLNYSVEHVFWIAKRNAPCILFFDEIDTIGTNREKSPASTSQLLTGMQGIDMSSKQIIVIGATNRLEQLDPSLLVDGRFGKLILVDRPKYIDRKTFLTTQIAKRCIQLSPDFIDHVAQETDGATYNDLKRIITEAIILSSIETRPVTQADFETTLDNGFRKIQPATNMSDEECRVIATYQAGKAVARHILKTVQEVVKITIKPVLKEVQSSDVGVTIKNNEVKTSDNERLNPTSKDSKIKLGEVFTKSSKNHHELLNDTEQKKECLALLAGSMALQLMFNQSYTQCNKHDRAEAMQIIYSLISQGERIDDQMKAQALKIKETYEKEIFAILKENKELLTKITDVLVQKQSIDRYLWHNLTQV